MLEEGQQEARLTASAAPAGAGQVANDVISVDEAKSVLLPHLLTIYHRRSLTTSSVWMRPSRCIP